MKKTKKLYKTKWKKLNKHVKIKNDINNNDNLGKVIKLITNIKLYWIKYIK